MTGTWSRPDWVIVGSPVRGGYTVWASRELDHVELQLVYDDGDLWGDPFGFQPFVPPRMRRIELTGSLRSVVVVCGQSYADCLAKLADFGEPGEWRGEDQPAPELPAFPELEAGPRALEPGDGS